MSCSCDKYPNCPCGEIFGLATLEVPKTINAELKSNASAFDDYIVPDDEITAVTNYYALLRKKFIHMKQERIIRKVVEHFHLQKGEPAA